MLISYKTNPPSLLDRVSVFIGTGFYISLLPTYLMERAKTEKSQRLIDRKQTGAGLLGTLEAALFYLWLPSQAYRVFFLVALGFVFFAVLVSGLAEKALGSHDDSRIVIDEWAGVWVALWGIRPHVGIAFVLAVIFFRLFDVMKGPLGRRLQNLSGGWGVTLDDIYAGLAANLCWRIAVGVFGLTH